MSKLVKFLPPKPNLCAHKYVFLGGGEIEKFTRINFKDSVLCVKPNLAKITTVGLPNDEIFLHC